MNTLNAVELCDFNVNFIMYVVHLNKTVQERFLR